MNHKLLQHPSLAILCTYLALGLLETNAEWMKLKLDVSLNGATGAVIAWDSTTYSFHAGYRFLNEVTGPGAAAFGWGSASGDSSFAAGGASADGEYSFAGGGGYAVEMFATAFGSTTYANGYSSFAAGEETYAGNEASVALGAYTYASGYVATALGFGTGAYDAAATAMGESTAAFGIASTAMGYQTQANAYASLAIGRFNVGAYTAHSDPNLRGTRKWYDADSIFEIGNGTGVFADPPQVRNRNAFTVYKNGDIKMQKAQGDISMGIFQ